MRIVADTNVIVSAFLWGGTPRRLLDAAEAQRVELLTSRALIAELEDVLARAKFAEQLMEAETGTHTFSVRKGVRPLFAMSPTLFGPTLRRVRQVPSTS